MEKEYYEAKEVAEILKTSVPTVYRKAKSGDIPSTGKRPNIKFPKDAIDAIAEVGTNEEDANNLTFTPTTIAESWEKQQMFHPYEDEDSVPFKTILQWRKMNNELTMNVKKGSKILGWVTFLPLDEAIIIALINDEMREKDIPIQAVKKWTEKNLSVYIPVIEVAPSGNIPKDRLIGEYLLRKTLRWALILTVQHDIKKWYGIGVTPEGQTILEALGFREINSLENGARKGYILETNTQPVKLIGHLLKEMEGTKTLLEKIPRSKTDIQKSSK